MENNNNFYGNVPTDNPVNQQPVNPNQEPLANEAAPICKNCGATLEAGQGFCSKCGAKVVEETPAANPAPQNNVAPPQNNVAPLQNNVAPPQNNAVPPQNNIPPQNSAMPQNAGMPQNSAMPQNSGMPQNGPANFGAPAPAAPAKKSPKTMIILLSVIGGAVLIAIGIVAFIFLSGPRVDSIKLESSSLTLEESQFYTMKCEILPKDTKVDIIWTSSDDKVAKVNEKGEITAVKEGECTIIAEAGGKKAECKITVESGPDLAALYDELDDSYYCELGSDNSYLSIDTNPLDLDDYSSTSAFELVKQANAALGLPDSVLSKMETTRALDGTQSYEGHKIKVSWTYHPDDGLEVMYERTE